MPHLLKNKDLILQVDLPEEGYTFSRFDWTGKISKVTYKNVDISGREKPDGRDQDLFGRGFFNEFGIDTALGFEETEKGDWFHKIGIGLLKKDSSEYMFHKMYQIRPAHFKSKGDSGKIVMTCTSEAVNGYSYVLEKEIRLEESGFSINYKLRNTGEKKISTQGRSRIFSGKRFFNALRVKSRSVSVTVETFTVVLPCSRGRCRTPT